ncbi:hypothetical protein [Streptomyces sp. NPDC005438]|uniref:hypothetical protein n=1 Tax=Streptomyces sp. NPDC005438 TaxID=3156880 RepID=UPI0033A01CE9
MSGAAGVPQGEELFLGGGCGDGAGEVAPLEVVAGLLVVGPGLGLGEVEGVGAERDDGAGGGVQGTGPGVVGAVALGEQGSAGGGPFGMGVAVAAESGGLLPGDDLVVEVDDFGVGGDVAFLGAGGGAGDRAGALGEGADPVQQDRADSSSEVGGAGLAGVLLGRRSARSSRG